MNNVIEVSGLVKTFGSRSGWFSGKKHQVEAVKGVSFHLAEGETLAVVGESGSGKSTLARMLVGLERPTSGSVTLMGEEMSAHSKRGDKAFGRMIQYVFQDPVASLNPRKTIADTLDVPLRYLCGYPAARRQARMRELMDAVQMPADALTGYPHEFSGGQAQRLAIARALAAHPRIGERASGASKEAQLSRGEQATLNISQQAVIDALHEGNLRYEQRFGRVFLIRAKGRSSEDILHNLQRRLENSPDAEDQETAQQLKEITLLRLKEIFQ